MSLTAVQLQRPKIVNGNDVGRAAVEGLIYGRHSGVRRERRERVSVRLLAKPPLIISSLSGRTFILVS